MSRQEKKTHQQTDCSSSFTPLPREGHPERSCSRKANRRRQLPGCPKKSGPASPGRSAATSGHHCSTDMDSHGFTRTAFCCRRAPGPGSCRRDSRAPPQPPMSFRASTAAWNRERLPKVGPTRRPRQGPLPRAEWGRTRHPSAPPPKPSAKHGEAVAASVRVAGTAPASLSGHLKPSSGGARAGSRPPRCQHRVPVTPAAKGCPRRCL